MDYSLSPASLMLCGILGYLIGSIPFAYLVTKRKAGMDIRRHGSRNVGALNAYEITGQKTIGRTVLALDMLKGLLPVVVCVSLGLSTPILVVLPAVVLGHCCPVWLRFHGGRGLATTAGALFLVNPAVVLVWCLAYLLGRRMKDQVHVASLFALGVTMAALVLLPIEYLAQTTLPVSGLATLAPRLFISILMMLLIVLSRHIEPILVLIRERNSAR